MFCIQIEKAMGVASFFFLKITKQIFRSIFLLWENGKLDRGNFWAWAVFFWEWFVQHFFFERKYEKPNWLITEKGRGPLFLQPGFCQKCNLAPSAAVSAFQTFFVLPKKNFWDLFHPGFQRGIMRIILSCFQSYQFIIYLLLQDWPRYGSLFGFSTMHHNLLCMFTCTT